MKKRKPVLFYMIGYPGSGKTTFAMQFAKNRALMHLYADKIGVEIYRQPTFSEAERQHVLEEMDWRAHNYLHDNVGVVYDANMNTVADRERLRDLAKRNKTIAIGIWIQTPPAIAEERLREVRTINDLHLIYLRYKTLGGIDYFSKIVAAFEAPRAEKNIVTTSGTAPFDQQFAEIEKQLSKLGVI